MPSSSSSQPLSAAPSELGSIIDAADAAATSVSDSSSLVADASDALLSAHTLLSQDGSLFGWCGTLIGAAVAARVASMPLLYYAQVQHARAARATTELARVQKFVRSSPGSVIQKYFTFRRLRSVALQSASTSPARLFPWYAVVNIPVFVTASLAIRRIASDPPEAWATDGVSGWFDNMSAADPTGALPVANTALWLYNAHMRGPRAKTEAVKSEAEEKNPSGAKGSAPQGVSTPSAARSGSVRRHPVLERIMSGETMTTGLQALALFSFPFIQHAPSGMFVFWITSGALTAVQRAVLSTDASRRSIGLPTSAELAAAAKAEGPHVLRATGRAVKAVREQLEHVQTSVLSTFSKRRVDENLKADVNRALVREKRHGRIAIDLEAIIREDSDSGRKYLAVIRKGSSNISAEMGT